jgi:TolB-like protein/DNA-binding winged helix-turn-helix (wHTH) protein
MAEVGRAEQTIRFGVFEVDLRSGEVRKAGVRIKLQEQPFKILIALLEHPGEVVTREELRGRIWPDESSGDFDHAVNIAVAKLRTALGDSADAPHLIETLHRRGYRFIFPLTDRSLRAQNVAILQSAPAPAQPERAQRGWNRRRVVAIAAGSLAVLAIATPLWFRSSTRSHDPGRQPALIQALAVLPLVNLSGEAEQEYFADGMTDALITELGKISTPRVISHQSVMQYKGSKKSLPEIAEELKVDAIIGGAVERYGDRVRVIVHLDQAAPESQLWAKKYDRSIRDVLVLQDDIARAVTDELQVELTPQERTRLASGRPVDPQAQDAFLRGQFFASKKTERDVQAGITYFREAIEKDPGYAPAYAGLASALFQLGNARFGGGGHSTKEILPEAKAATVKALELDPSLAAAHLARAWILFLDWNWSESEKEHQLVLKLSPNSMEGHLHYASYLNDMGRFDEGMAQINYTIQLDPSSPGPRGALGFTAFCARQYDLALEELGNAEDDHLLGRTYAAKKMYPEAIAAFQRLSSQLGRQPLVVSDLAWAYGLAGRKQEAQKLINELNEIARHRYVAPILFMTAYIGLGDKDKALTWLERGYEEHDAWLVFLKVGPTWDPLRSERRFQAVLRRMNFPQ